MAEKTKEKETRLVAPWRPFMGITGWERDMDRMLDDFFGRRTRPWWPERWFRADDMEVKPPIVDVFEEKDDIVVKAELPGMEKDNIEVNLTASYADHQRGEEKRGRDQRRKLLSRRALLREFSKDIGFAERRSRGQSESLVQKRHLGNKDA